MRKLNYVMHYGKRYKGMGKIYFYKICFLRWEFIFNTIFKPEKYQVLQKLESPKPMKSLFGETNFFSCLYSQQRRQIFSPPTYCTFSEFASHTFLARSDLKFQKTFNLKIERHLIRVHKINLEKFKISYTRV